MRQLQAELCCATYLELCILLTHVDKISRAQICVKCTWRLSYVIQKGLFCFWSVRHDVCVCVCVKNGGWWWEEGVWAAVYTEQELLSRGSASWVCCWPDQLAVCLVGVWHITTKGSGQTDDCTALINPPIWVPSTSFFPILCCSLSCGMQSANNGGSYGPSGRSNLTDSSSGAHLRAFLSAVWRYIQVYWIDVENFLFIYFCMPRLYCTLGLFC